MQVSDHILEAVYSGQLLAFGPVQPKRKLEPSSLRILVVNRRSMEFTLRPKLQADNG